MKNLYIITLLFFSLSCQSPQKNNNQYNAKPIIFQSIKIPLDSITSSEPNKVQLIESDSGDYLVIINKILPSIDFFSLEKFQKEKSIKFYRDGINKIGVLTGFQVFSKDTLLITSSPANISMFNFNGDKIEDFPINGESQFVQTINSNNKTPLLIRGGLIFGAYPFITRFYETSKENISKINFIFNLNLNTGAINWLPYTSPDNFWKDGRRSPGFQWTQRGDSIVTVLESEATLRIFSIKKNEVIKSISIETKNKVQQSTLTKIPEGNEGIKRDLQEGSMNIILYDKYRDVFYCFYHIRIDPDRYDNNLIDLYLRKPKIGLILLDPNLNVINEFTFDDFEIDDYNSFVGKKGLYVSNNHRLNPNYDENFLKYYILRFNELAYEN